VRRNVECLGEFRLLDRADDAAAQRLFCCAQQNALSRNAVIDAKGLADLGIVENDDLITSH
jgi:hypothetical protein